MPPRKALGHVPPSGNPRVPVPPIRFEEVEAKAPRQARATQASGRVKRRGFVAVVTSLLVRIFALYTIIAALFTCSSHPFSFQYSAKDSRAICRSLAQGKSNLLPVVTPLVRSAHAKIDPYTGPYVKAIRPYTQAAWKTTRPYAQRAQKQGKVVYNKHLEPMRKKAIKRGRAYTDPHIKTFNKHYRSQVQPHVDNLNKAVRPYQDIYTRDVAPYLSQAYVYSLATGGTLYTTYVNQVHPTVVASLQQLHSFYINHVDPATRRAYSLYVRPQVERLLAKVFERKAHATGSEAIAQAKQEVKVAAKEGAARSEEKVVEAEKEALRKHEEPSVIEQAQQAAESLMGIKKNTEDDVDTARLDAELDAELEMVKEQLEAWESGMTKLIGQEYKLFTERISDLRNRRLADLPDHFASLTETFVEDEVAAVLTRLERVYKKLSKSDMAISEQVSEANAQHKIQKAKLAQSEESLDSQVRSYALDLERDEIKSLEASAGEVRRYVKEAQRSYVRIMDEATFQRSVEDYEGWDNGMMRRAQMLEEDLRSLLAGGKVISGMDAVDLRKEPKLDAHIAELQGRVKKLYSTARSQVDSYATSGNMQLRGEGALGAISDATDAVGEQARALAEGAASSMLVAAMSARKKLGLAPKEAPGILERVQAGVKEAQESVSSVVGATPSAKSAGDYVDSVASVVGYKTEPSSYVDVVADAGQDALQGATSLASVAGQRAGDAFTAATTSAGNEYRNARDYLASAAPTGVGKDGMDGIVGMMQEQLGSVSISAAKVIESAGASGFAMVEDVVDTGAKGVDQGTTAAQDIYDTVQTGAQDAGEAFTATVQRAGQAVSDGAVHAGEAVRKGAQRVGGALVEDDPADKLVGKRPDDKDFNTVGKAAEALKEHIVHMEL